MLIEIQSLDNGSGTNPKLDIYKVYNVKQKLSESRPYCVIWEEDFFNLFNDPEKEFDKACDKGKIHFNVSLVELDKACLRHY